jgi:hypothetical protein
MPVLADKLTKPGNQTTNDKLREMVGCTLQDRSDHHDQGTEKDCLAATQPITHPDCGNRSGETSQVIGSNNDT